VALESEVAGSEPNKLVQYAQILCRTFCTGDYQIGDGIVAIRILYKVERVICGGRPAVSLPKKTKMAVAPVLVCGAEINYSAPESASFQRDGKPLAVRAKRNLNSVREASFGEQHVIKPDQHVSDQELLEKAWPWE
jgi:hypothetical protein